MLLAELENNIDNCEMELFANNMQVHFGFHDYVSKLLYKLYKILEMDTAVKNPNKEFFRLIASVDYNTWQWEMTAGVYTQEYQIVQTMEEYGFSEGDSTYTYAIIKGQHIISSYSSFEVYLREIKGIGDVQNSEDLLEYKSEFEQYSGKIDFSHWASTLATYQNSGVKKWLASIGANFFNKYTNADDSSDYVGDIYGTNGVTPVLTPDDYKADLDTVNLKEYLKTNDNLIEVFNEYYGGISNNTINRADNFVENIGKYMLNSQWQAYLSKQLSKLRQGPAQLRDEVSDEAYVSYNFFENVYSGQQELIYYDKTLFFSR